MWKWLPVLSNTLFLLLLPLAARAQPFVQCRNFGIASVPVSQWCSVADLLNIPARIYNWATGFAASVLVMLIAFAGVRMLLFYFSDAPEGELKAAKDTLRHAIFGFLLVTLSWLIITALLALFGVGASAPFYQRIFGP